MLNKASTVFKEVNVNLDTVMITIYIVTANAFAYLSGHKQNKLL